MLRVHLKNVTPGMTLALPVRHPQAARQVLLKVGYEFEAPAIRRLGDLGVDHVWVRYPSLAFLSEFIDERVILAQGKIIETLAKTFDDMECQSTLSLPAQTYTRAITALVKHLTSNPQAALFLGDLGESRGDLLRHSSTVCYLSLLLGLKLQAYIVRQRKHIHPVLAKEIISLGLGAILHDVGLLRLETGVLARYQTTGDESDPEWRDHTRQGYTYVRGRVPPSAATVVLNHHQRVDGSGFAGPTNRVLDRKRIHVFARIVGLADEFDRLRHPPHAAAPPMPTVAVLAMLASETVMARFDLEVMRALFLVVPPYPPGTIVRLSDGAWAVAIDHNPYEPCRPKVQLIPAPCDLLAEVDSEPGPVIDLASAPTTLMISHVDDMDVADYNFAPPPFMQEIVGSAVYW